jgi:hypothetical protein
MHQVTALITTDVADIILKLTSAAFFLATLRNYL